MSPLRSRVWDGEKLIGGGPYVPPEDFILGVTEPTEENSGPRIAPTVTYGSPGNPYHLTITTPGVYSGIEVWGRITITPQTGVTLLDTRVHMTGGPTSDVYGILAQHADAYGHQVAFCHVDIPEEGERQNERYAACVRGRGFLVTRSILEHTVDGVSAVTFNSASQIRKVQVHGNLIRELVDRPSLFQSDGIAHCDGVQAMGGVELEVIGNTIYGGSTSCVILTQSGGSAWQGFGPVTIKDNWLYGDPDKGATVNITSTGGLAVPSLTVHRNRVDRAGYKDGQILASVPNRVPAAFGATSGVANGDTASVNAWVYGGADHNLYMDDNSVARAKAG